MDRDSLAHVRRRAVHAIKMMGAAPRAAFRRMPMSRLSPLFAMLCLPGLAVGQGESASEQLDRLEARLLGARRVHIEAKVQASGALQASFEGVTDLQDRNRARFSYTGSLAGKPAVVSLESNGRTLDLRNGAQSRNEPTGAESNRALLLGFTRMGLLHNLARCVQLAGPDHAGGGVTPWITLDSFRPTTFAQDGELFGAPSLGFDLLVSEKPAATVQLWLDPATGLPRRREQVVRFPQGEMKVVETYTQIVVE